MPQNKIQTKEPLKRWHRLIYDFAINEHDLRLQIYMYT